MAGRCCFDFSSCSNRMMTNNAVIAKSMPVVSKGIIFPSPEPIILPVIQDN